MIKKRLTTCVFSGLAILLAASLLFVPAYTVLATFANVSSTEQLFNAVTSASDNVSSTIPDLGANSIGVVLVLNEIVGLPDQTNAGVTWNGVAMTESVDDVNGNSAKRVSIFTLVNPADNGTYSINLTYGISRIHTTHIVVAWADATNAISVDDTSVATGTSQNPAIVVTQANANELVMSGSASEANAVGNPSTTGCTELQNADGGANTSISCYSQPAGSGNETHTHNYSQSGVYAIAGISFKEAAGGEPAEVPAKRRVAVIVSE